MRSRLKQSSKVAAVVVASTDGPWLRQSLQSLEAQTRPPDGIVVIGVGDDPVSEALTRDFPGVRIVDASAGQGALHELLASESFDAVLLQRGEDWATRSRLRVLLDAAVDERADGVGSAFLVLDPSTGRAHVEVPPAEDGVLDAVGVELGTALLSTGLLSEILTGGFGSLGDRLTVAHRLVNVRDVLCHQRAAGPPLLDLLAVDGERDRQPPRRGKRKRTTASAAPRPAKRSAARVDPAATRPPLIVVAADPEVADLLVWVLAQHRDLLPVLDTSWMVALAGEVERSVTTTPTASTSLAIAQGEARTSSARAAFEHAVWSQQGNVVAARRPSTESGWVVALDASADPLHAVERLYPDARWVHVLTDPPGRSDASGRARWRERTATILDLERRLDADVVTRVESRDLIDAPTRAIEECLSLLGLADDGSCAAALADVVLPADAEAFTTVELDDVDILRIALARRSESMDAAIRRARPQPASLAVAELAPSSVTSVTSQPAADGVGADAGTPSADLRGVRRLVAAHVPRGAVVGVVSRGDDALCELGPVDAWHFPRAADGSWAGYHPADGRQAVEMLAELRGAGGSFLLVPAPYRWWLEYYDDLRAVLDGRELASDDAGDLFDLRPYLTDRGAVRRTTSKVRPAGSPSQRSTQRRVVAHSRRPRFRTRVAPDLTIPAARDVVLDRSATLDDPLVSVIVTAYNATEHIEPCLRSLASQSYHPIEIVVVDDASTDDTLECLDRLAGEIPNMRVVSAARNGGTYFCRNLGIHAARGSLLTFNDADDVSHPDRIRRQVERLQRSSNADVVVACDYQRLDPDGTVLLNRGVAQRLSLQTLLVPRTVFEQMGYFDTVRMSGDAEFLDRFRKRFSPKSVLRVEEALYFASTRADSLTATGGAEASLGSSKEDAKRPVEDFLSEPRKRYLSAYRAWHDREPSGLHIDFPMRARPFEAPTPHVRDTLAPGRVIAGMATHSARRDVLAHAVRSIAHQVDELHVHLNDYDEPPADVRLHNVVFTTPADHGDINDIGKFLVADHLDGTEFLFTVDDDIIYPRDYVSRMVVLLEQLGREVAVGVHAAVLANPLRRFYEGRSVAHFKRGATHRHVVDVVGTGTMAIHSSLLPVTLDDFKAPGMADLWFAIGCKERGIPRVLIDRPDGWLTPIETETSIWSVHSGSDDTQTRAARDAGPWGREQLQKEAFDWRGDDDLLWRALGFSSASQVALPERTW